MDAFNSAAVKKTQVPHQPDPNNSVLQPPQITVNGQPLGDVDNFTYLGSYLSTKANIDSEIERRIQAANTVMGRLKGRVFSNNDILESTNQLSYQFFCLAPRRGRFTVDILKSSSQSI